ncbi:MAG: LLM class flavin-dependent oxidoreductase [Sneathiellaceae bacterium]
MPVRVIGMIGVAPSADDAAVHVITGGVSAAYLAQFAQAHDEAGFDLVLVGYTAQSAEGFAVAGYAASRTERLGFLVAHRPGFVAPTLMARKIATFDHLWQGRLAVHIIAGVSDAEQMMDGDPLPKPERYRRAAEYLSVMHRAWTATEPFDFDGDFYTLRGARSDVQPWTRPHPLLFFGGSSAEALAMGAAHCDVFAMFGEPRAAVAARIADMDRRAARHRRAMQYNLSFRPILGATEGAAWDRARRILTRIESSIRDGSGGPRLSTDESGRRLLAAAAEAEIHDERLWMPIAQAYQAQGNTTCLVGTPEQVADSLLAYYRLGVTGFLIRGFDPLPDTVDFGRELIPRLRAGAAAIDASRQAAGQMLPGM